MSYVIVSVCMTDTITYTANGVNRYPLSLLTYGGKYPEIFLAMPLLFIGNLLAYSAVKATKAVASVKIYAGYDPNPIASMIMMIQTIIIMI